MYCVSQEAMESDRFEVRSLEHLPGQSKFWEGIRSILTISLFQVVFTSDKKKLMGNLTSRTHSPSSYYSN